MLARFDRFVQRRRCGFRASARLGLPGAARLYPNRREKRTPTTTTRIRSPKTPRTLLTVKAVAIATARMRTIPVPPMISKTRSAVGRSRVKIRRLLGIPNGRDVLPLRGRLWPAAVPTRATARTPVAPRGLVSATAPRRTPGRSLQVPGGPGWGAAVPSAPGAREFASPSASRDLRGALGPCSPASTKTG